MQNGVSYIIDSKNFKSKTRNINIPNDDVLVTAEVVGLHLSIQHEAGLSVLRKALGKKLVRKYLLKILLKWLNLFWKTTFLSWILIYINRFQVLLLPLFICRDLVTTQCVCRDKQFLATMFVIKAWENI